MKKNAETVVRAVYVIISTEAAQPDVASEFMEINAKQRVHLVGMGRTVLISAVTVMNVTYSQDGVRLSVM